MSRIAKPKNVLLYFETDKTTLIKRTDIVEWLDFAKTKGAVNINGKRFVGEAVYFHGKIYHIFIVLSRILLKVCSKSVFRFHLIFSRFPQSRYKEFPLLDLFLLLLCRPPRHFPPNGD